jgi:C-8 sterol isomerase
MIPFFIRLAAIGILWCPIQLRAEPLFEPADLQKLVKTSIEERKSKNLTLDQQLNFIREQLSAEHPDRINQKPKWVFNQTAGALGQLQILFCSPQEYLIFFGSTVGTEGHSGRYDMDVWDAMIQGEMWTALQGELQKSVYKEGDLAHLPKHKAKAYKIPEFGYMLEYGRGNIAKALGQGVLMPAMFINQDFASMKEQLGECAGMAIKGLFTKKS